VGSNHAAGEEGGGSSVEVTYTHFSQKYK
jgi:hypothetical protein